MQVEGEQQGQRDRHAQHSDPTYQVIISLREIALQLNLVAADFAAQNDLHVTDLRAITELLDAERSGLTATPTWLCERLRLNSASVTALIDRLERAGHVQRHRDIADRRRVHLTVTDSAKRLGVEFFGPLIDHIIAIMDGFARHERETIMRFLADVGTAIPRTG